MMKVSYNLIFVDFNTSNQSYISEILSKYMHELPDSKLGIFQNAAVATDAAPCAEIAR